MAPKDQLNAIIASPLPALINPALRGQPRKVWSTQIRALFKQIGLTGIRVTTPNYSMASSIDIEIPSIEHDHREIDARGGAYQPYGIACEHCKTRQAASAKLKQIILAAFPDLDDRSDYQSDYFNYCFSIN